MSEVSNLVLWVATRILLIQVKEQEYFQWLVEDEVCIGPYPLHGVVWLGTALLFGSNWNQFPLMLSWRYFMCFSRCVIYPLLFCPLYENTL